MAAAALLLLCIGLVAGNIGSHNVVFQKVNEVTTTRSRWLVTFVVDLKPYVRAMNQLSASIDNATDTSWEVVQHYFDKGNQFVKSFVRLSEELKIVRDTYNGLLEHFVEYRTLQGVPTRSRRSLLPFVGKAMHFLFGTLSDSDLSKMRTNIQTLSENQQEISHVVQESLTIINTSRVRIAENRQTINELVSGLAQVDAELRTVTDEMQKKISELSTFVTAYSQVDVVISEIKSVMHRVVVYISNISKCS